MNESNPGIKYGPNPDLGGVTSSRSGHIEQHVEQAKLFPHGRKMDPLTDPSVQRAIGRYHNLVEQRYDVWIRMKDRQDRCAEAREDLAAIEREISKWEGQRRAPLRTSRDAAEQMLRRLRVQRDQTVEDRERLRADIAARGPEFQEISGLADTCKRHLVDILGVAEQDLPPLQVGRRPIAGEHTTSSVRS